MKVFDVIIIVSSCKIQAIFLYMYCIGKIISKKFNQIFFNNCKISTETDTPSELQIIETQLPQFNAIKGK